MAKEIRWSIRADQERIEILEYWINRNKSSVYSVKLSKLFRYGAEQLAEFPELGKPTDLPLIRIKIIRDYFMYYKITPDYIEILTIWDTRRNPRKFRI